MISIRKVSAIVVLSLAASITLLNLPARAQAPSAAQTQKTVEDYLRNLYAFGPDVKLVVGAFTDTAVPGLQSTDIDVTIGENKQTVKFFVSKDGKYLVQGEMSDLTKDPLAENRSKMDLKNAPVWGDAKAPVTLVEYSDFECPVCRNLHEALKSILPKYKGQIKLIFKDYPIEQIHPWARTAAIAGRCAYQQDPNAFWKVYDLIYDGQELISAANAYSKMTDFAAQAGLNADAFKSCMAGPEAGAAVDASRANGQAVDVNSTPTVFVNGRRLIGADSRTLEQYIQYEIGKSKTSKSSESK